MCVCVYPYHGLHMAVWGPLAGALARGARSVTLPGDIWRQNSSSRLHCICFPAEPSRWPELKFFISPSMNIINIYQSEGELLTDLCLSVPSLPSSFLPTASVPSFSCTESAGSNMFFLTSDISFVRLPIPLLRH